MTGGLTIGVQMRTFLLLWIVAASGCVHSSAPSAVTVDSAKPLSPQLVSTMTNALTNSPTFLDLRHRAKRSMVFIDEQEGKWARIELYSESKDFFHRWATLKVEMNTGAILRLGTDEKLEDKGFVEFQPQK